MSLLNVAAQTPRNVTSLARVYDFLRLRQYPLTPSLDELVKHDADVCQDESAHDEAKKLCCVSSAQFESNVSLRGMLQPWIFHLTNNLICTSDQY